MNDGLMEIVAVN